MSLSDEQAALGKFRDLKERGRFITLEGGEGAGKSTQLRHILRWLREIGVRAIGTREPGGSKRAEALRKLLLSGRMAEFGPAAEAILFTAARIDHIDNTIDPALSAGVCVVCDRFADSTRVYQGVLGELDPRFLRALERVALGSLRPDLTLILDVPPAQGLERARTKRLQGQAPDRFEREDLGFHEKLRAGFLAIAAAEPERCAVIDASGPEEDVTKQIIAQISERLLFQERKHEADPS
ncbi:MAG TPA: dTMP kinase [Methylocella sp.]|nr:dTMP kinase [Methylocella sp.]